MKLNPKTALFEGCGILVRAQLTGHGAAWALYKINPKYSADWTKDPAPVLLTSIPAANCLSAAKAVEKWLETRPFK